MKKLNIINLCLTIPILIGAVFYIIDSSLLLKSIAYGNLDNQNELEKDITDRLNQSGIGPLGFGGKTTVLGCYLNIGNQRASGVRIVSIRPSCFVEPRVFTLKL